MNSPAKVEQIINSTGNLNQHLSTFNIMTSADLVGKAIILILFIASIWSWVIMLDKYWRLRKLNKYMHKFERLFWSGQMLDDLYEKVKHNTKQPLSKIFVAAVNEWRRNDVNKTGGNKDYGIRAGLKDRIYQAMNLIRNKEIELAESGLTFLATVGSTAPFVGLFGTVWGIMHSLQAIAASKNTTLAVVAPGIAEALLITLIGLFAAIPATIFNNILSNKVNILANKVDDFMIELHTLLSRAIDEVNN